MGISDKIESFIIELLKDEDNPNDWLELRRNELASVFNCVPSQINYVISTRFNPERGYMVESKRGGGGYLKIKRINISSQSPIYDAVISINDSLDFGTAKAVLDYLLSIGYIDIKNANLILSGISDNALNLNNPQKDMVRASIFKNMLLSLIN